LIGEVGFGPLSKVDAADDDVSVIAQQRPDRFRRDLLVEIATTIGLAPLEPMLDPESVN